MSKGKQAAKNSPSINGGIPLYYCHSCQKNFIDANALRMHCRSAKVHRNTRTSDPVPVSSADKPKITLAASSSSLSPAKKNTFDCNICNRKFVNKAALKQHKKTSQTHKDRANPKKPRQNKPKAGAVPEANSTVSERYLADIEEPECLVEYYLEDQLWTLPLPVQLSLSAPLTGFQSSFVNDSDLRISLASAIQGAQHDVYDLPVRPSAWVPSPFSKTYRNLDEASNYDNLAAASPSVEHQREDTNSGGSEIPSSPSPPPDVPKPWSSISLSERDEILAALQAQCHSLECLKSEGYWTQTPSAVDIDMTRKCRDCGVSKRRINTKDAEYSVCRFHPAKKPFQQGIIRGRGPGVPKKAGCINCTQPGPSNCKSNPKSNPNSKGCILLSSHTFASPIAKLSKMKPTPLPVPYKPTRAAIALDCEMVGVLETTPDSDNREQSEVVRVVAIDFLTGEVLLDTYVSPLGRVISWRTKYSGVNASILAQKKKEGRVLSGGWAAARKAIYSFIDADTILIGHGLNNDLAVLGMVHTRAVDSAVLTRMAVDEDCQRHWKLKTLAKEFLGLSIQVGDGKDGHDCVEDTFAAREVALWCLLNGDRLQSWAANERRVMEGKQKKSKKEPSVTHGEGCEVST